MVSNPVAETCAVRPGCSYVVRLINLPAASGRPPSLAVDQRVEWDENGPEVHCPETKKYSI